VRTRTPSQGSFEVAQTVIERWEATEEKQELHPAFELLGTRRNSTSGEPSKTVKLRQLDPVIINKVCINFQTSQFGKVLILTFADGTVEYRDRFTFEELYAIEDTEQISNLRQVGWTYMDNGPCHQIAFSPTFCSRVQVGDDGKLRWSKLHYAAGDIGNTMQEPHYGGSIAGLVITAASAMYHQANYDDMLAMVQPFASKKAFTHDWISELTRVLKIQVDYLEDGSSEIMRNQSLPQCLSIMNNLGFKGEAKTRSFQSKFAMLNLNVRNVTILMTLASNTSMPRDKVSPLDEPEVVNILAGCAKWSFDFLAWFVDSLLELSRDEGLRELLTNTRYHEVGPYLYERNDVSIHLLLASSNRGFLTAMCRRLSHLEALGNKAIDFYRRASVRQESGPASRGVNPQLQEAYQRMQQVTSAALVKTSELDKLLCGVTSDIKQSYQGFIPNMIKQQAKPPQGKQIDLSMKASQVQFELSLLLCKPPHPPFIPVLRKFLYKDLQAFRKQLDEPKLFFANYDALEVQDDKRSLAIRATKGLYVDVFKRIELHRGTAAAWRRCARCTAVMEDIHGTRPGLIFILNQQRKCSCGGMWALIPNGKLFL
jgi:mediator of RNA polymerase II transcription subunit 16